MMLVLWTIAAFLSGSLMFSYWLGRAANRELRGVGDGNPGALNLWKAAGFRLGLAGVVLDFLKGYLPLLGLVAAGYAQGGRLIPLAIAPIAGHAFSPFLGGRGGKAIAVTFGVWSAITGFEAALAYAVLLAVLKGTARLLRGDRPKRPESDAAQVVVGTLLLPVYLLASQQEAALLYVWLGSFAIIVYKHRKELASLALRLGKRNAGKRDNSKSVS
ncbi:glycerol-3-phosphate acyltransferase [Cohnella cellulosilytica]|uniref:Glycerol-3-phosphate acyltransferase n=1 Tax=Cohnella cellulosilytica TaxID=986710 RepID=A0ABW2F4L5_9BACL